METMKVLLHSVSPAEAPRRAERWDIDSPESARRAHFEWSRSEQVRMESLRRELNQTFDYNTSSYAGVGFRRVEPEPLVATPSLERRLAALCEKMRARY